MVIPDDLKQLYPWSGKYLPVNGGKMHYLDVGSKSPVTILAVHGNPTWSFYWRSLINEFSDDFRLVVPDHIGCGLSDKPQNWDYKLSQHIDNLIALVEHLDLHNILLVVHDWGGAIGTGFATEYPDKVLGMVVTNTAAFRSQDIPWSIASCRIPGFGALAVRGFNAFAQVATWRATAKKLAPEIKKGLTLPYNSWANRIATLRFVEDIPLRESHPSYARLLQIEENLHKLKNHPMEICWGEKDFCFTPAFRKKWEAFFPDATTHAWDDVGHYVMEDAPERVIEVLHSLLNKLTVTIS